MTSKLTFERVTGHIGALVSGLDITKPLSDNDFEALRLGLAEHLVLFFRDQEMSPPQHRDFAARFGRLAVHPTFPCADGIPEVTVLDYDEKNKSKVEEWHADMTFKPHPPLGSVLMAQIIPPTGGDTLFASSVAAFEGLSDRWQHFLDGLYATHSFTHGFRHTLAEPGAYDRLRGAIADNPPVAHPVVRTHPVTGKKGLFVNEVFTTQIVGMSESESRAVLDFLYRHAATPEYVCRFKWEPNSVAFWDNRATLHRPVNDYWPARRRMQRVVVEGEKPA
ncbi:MAG: taurine dioxygenase [Myxococcales bacterium]|nr:taurine dioxygenase [Myxococcales bacterium]